MNYEAHILFGLGRVLVSDTYHVRPRHIITLNYVIFSYYYRCYYRCRRVCVVVFVFKFVFHSIYGISECNL